MRGSHSRNRRSATETAVGVGVWISVRLVRRREILCDLLRVRVKRSKGYNRFNLIS